MLTWMAASPTPRSSYMVSSMSSSIVTISGVTASTGSAFRRSRGLGKCKTFSNVMVSPVFKVLWYYRAMKRRIPVAQAIVTVGGGSPSLGGVADNLHSATSIFTNIFTDIFYIIGVM